MLGKIKPKLKLFRIKCYIVYLVLLKEPPNISGLQYLVIIILWYLSCITEGMYETIIVLFLCLWVFLGGKVNSWLINKAEKKMS